MRLLLERDGDEATLVSRCEDAACLAEEWGHTEIAKILREYKKS
jgi:hypothetical protein